MTPATFRRIRKQLGLTQTEMGQFLGGYALRTVQDWEAKKRKIPPAVRMLLADRQNAKRRPSRGAKRPVSQPE